MSMASRVLLVEGTDDFHVMLALRKFHGMEQFFAVEKTDGIDRLLETVPVRLRTASELERLAVVMDADERLQSRWQQLRDRVVAAGYADMPAALDPRGTVVTLHDGKRFGVWIMPNNTLPGILEDFVSFLVPPDDDLVPFVDQFLDSIPPPPRRFPLSRRAKARIHSWLAIQEEPGKPMGQAITARYLDAQAAWGGPFLQWLKAALVT